MSFNLDFKKTLLLRLSDNGEPITNTELYGNGVLTLPSLPYKLDEITTEHPIFSLRLLIAAGAPIARNGLIWTNCTENLETKYDRNKFYKRIIKSTFHNDDYIDLKIYRPGSYCFYISFRNNENVLETTKKYYFLLPPTLTINDEYLPLNAINCQTVVSKWVGNDLEKNWYKLFDKISKKKYNMVHFTPLTKRGESNSPYSIYDQLLFDPEVFPNNVEDVAKMVKKLETDHNILSLTDIVFNHTANNSDWLRTHPDSGYNQFTAPHLIAAMELDASLLEFSVNLKNLNYPCDIETDDDIFKIMDGIKIHVLGQLKLWEFYVVNIESLFEELEQLYDQVKECELIDNDGNPVSDIPEETLNNFEKLAAFIIDTFTNCSFEVLGERYSHKIDNHQFIGFLKGFMDFEIFDIHTKDFVTNLINEINLPLYKVYDDDINEILEQLYNRIKYLRLDQHGPRLGKVTMHSPLTEPYFTRFYGNDGIKYALANNGWIWNGNPLIDFASHQSKCYLRREVIVWGDCVKLRYGRSPQDSPYLWERMSKYVQINAKIFDGFRIDNCHSTPLHVGEYFLDVAREVNPNLYIVAELFSGSERTDCIFVERLGISSLIREAMQAWSEEELASLIYKYGGRPIGSYKYVPMDNFAYSPEIMLDVEYCFFNTKDNAVRCVSEVMIPQILTAQPPHAMFMDCSHDNQTPYQKRTVEDTLPNAALVALCSTAIGSVYGYDEIYPELLDLVKEKRHYDLDTGDNEEGIAKIRRLLNDIKQTILEDSNEIEDSEMHVHREGQYIFFHRTNSKSGSGYYLIARTKFDNSNNDQILPPVVLSQTTCKLRFGYTLEKVGDLPTDDDKLIKGIRTRLREIDNFKIFYNVDTQSSEITLPENFSQGSIAIFETQQNGVDDFLDHYIRSGAINATKELDFESLNAILYRCEAEELDISGGQGGAYEIPGHGKIIYCGLQGWISLLRKVVINNDLGHPVSDNLREGHWALDYVVNRLDYYKDKRGISEIQEWLRSRFDKVKQLPSYLVPCYFAMIVGVMYECCRFRAMQLFPKYIGDSTLFIQSLALTSVQLVSTMSSTSILPNKNVPAMAAGLPHFSTDYMRCWGRDVFISLRGLLLATGRYVEAKEHILAFAKTLKHGLIPNLLDAGRNPRYNARDAAWFFLQAIQDYVNISPEGELILQESVTRRFPLDDKFIDYLDPLAFSYSSTIEEVIYEILSRHAKGISYREANAGFTLDRVMKDEGFNVEIHVDWKTGLIHGGNEFNCGTWMDKMGESVNAKSSGVPGTARNGAAVEINGLLKSTLRFVVELHKQGKFKYTDVIKKDGSKITFEAWDDLLQRNFEKEFYIPIDPREDKLYNFDSTIINRRGIYRDLNGSSKPYEDYQLRPNFFIAMSVAPELFNPEHARIALDIADAVIRGPLGMRTLDPSDYNYRPDYNNGEDSDNFATSKGRNYHQGPEWVWCFGYFLRSYHFFQFLENPMCRNEAKQRPSSYLFQQLYRRLQRHREWIAESPWSGLTELTNKDGSLCDDSSPTQAWSSGCLLDLLFDVKIAYEDDWYRKQIQEKLRK